MRINNYSSGFSIKGEYIIRLRTELPSEYNRMLNGLIAFNSQIKTEVLPYTNSANKHPILAAFSDAYRGTI